MIAPLDTDDPAWYTPALNDRFVRHCRNAYSSEPVVRVWARAVARGLYIILRDRALAGDDEAAYGCPHFLLYDDAD